MHSVVFVDVVVVNVLNDDVVVVKVVDVSLDEYDGSKSNLDLDFIDYGDSEVK